MKTNQKSLDKHLRDVTKPLDKKKTICKHHFVEVREEFTDVNSYSKVQIIIYCENCGKVSHDKTLW